MIMEIDFITSNKGKIAALKRSFLNAGRFDIKVNQVQADIVEPQLNNIADVSKYKAMEAFKILKKPMSTSRTNTLLYQMSFCCNRILNF